MSCKLKTHIHVSTTLLVDLPKTEAQPKKNFKSSSSLLAHRVICIKSSTAEMVSHTERSQYPISSAGQNVKLSQPSKKTPKSSLPKVQFPPFHRPSLHNPPMSVICFGIF